MPGDVFPVHTWMVWHRWEFLMMTSVHPPEMTRFDCLVANFFHLDIRCNCFYNGDSFRNLNGILGFVSPNTLMFFFSSFTSFSFSRSAGLFWPVLRDGLNRKRARTRGANLGTSKCSVSNKKKSMHFTQYFESTECPQKQEIIIFSRLFIMNIFASDIESFYIARIEYQCKYCVA